MKIRSILIKPASALCNMSCRYCFYHDVSEHREQYSYGVMDNETMIILIQKALMNVEQVNFIFQGGEPTLAGYAYFNHFISTVKQKMQSHQKVSYYLQTNGYYIEDKLIQLFKENRFLIGISLDGYEAIHNQFREFNGVGSFQNVLETIEKIKKNKIDFNILTVLTKELSKHPQQVYQFYKRNHFKYIQFIPCLPNIDENPKNDPYSLTPKQFASFYNKIFSLWLADYEKGNALSINLFDNLIPMFNGIAPQMCGMLGVCQAQFVIESNGNVYPCDFYCTDEYCIGNIKENDFSDFIKSSILRKFVNEPRRQSEFCLSCEFYSLCAGNCKRMNIAYFDDKGYCGYKEFLKKNLKSFKRITKDFSC